MPQTTHQTTNKKEYKFNKSFYLVKNLGVSCSVTMGIVILGFFKLSTIDTLGQVIICYSGLFCALWDVQHIHNLCPQVTPLSCDNKKCYQTFSDVLGVGSLGGLQDCLLVENHYNKWIPAKMISSFSKFIMQDFKTI